MTEMYVEADGSTQLLQVSACACSCVIDMWPAAAFTFGSCLACFHYK